MQAEDAVAVVGDYPSGYGGYMREVGITLKRDASAIVNVVEAGETIVITRRGAPVARMGPLAAPGRLERLVDQGLMRGRGSPRAFRLTCRSS
jgi:prevent-host-death family protein